MNNDIKNAIKKGNLILFLGAGASKGSKSQNGDNLLDGYNLAKHIAESALLEFNDESLDITYSAAKSKLGSKLNSVLESLFKFTSPSASYLKLASLPWRRIYTLNIDDSLEKAIRKLETQNLRVFISKDRLIERDPFFTTLDLIKLNGSIDRLDDGLIFSPSEYANATASQLPWYEEVATEFSNCMFLFVGTKLDEPLFKYHIERYKKLSGLSQGTSYVLTPSASQIQSLDLLNYKIQHIPGTLEDFTNWLDSEFQSPLSALDVAKANIPIYATLLDPQNNVNDSSLFNNVAHITRSGIGSLRGAQATQVIRDFYKGFKPTWNDIADEIPAYLDVFEACIEFIKSRLAKDRLLSIIGPSGCGKTTLLMQVLYKISEDVDTDVYYIAEPIDNLHKTLSAIHESAKAGTKIIVGIDNLDYFTDSLLDALKNNGLSKLTLIGTERSSIWNKRTSNKLGIFSEKVFPLKEFTEDDVPRLLEKVKLHGYWTRLGKLTDNQRRKELIERADKQLLIALLEATNGNGYEAIIEDEYNSIATINEKKLFLLAGLGTVHRIGMPLKLAQRALSDMGILSEYSSLLNSLSGIVVESNNKLNVRHETYVRYLLNQVIDPSLVQETIVSFLSGFSLYGFPFSKNSPKSEFNLYKAIINHRFLFDILKGNEFLITGLYKSLEKTFEEDGLFLLQYGLALRDLKLHSEALEKLEAACDAYRMDHTEHALAKQLLINGIESEDKLKAYSNFERAKEILNRLDKTIDSDDTYPYVTLTEGHIQLAIKFEGKEAAQKIAKTYERELKNRGEKYKNDVRLNESWQKVFRFSTTGTWSISNE